MPVVPYRCNLISFNTTIILQYYYSYRRSSTVINPHRCIYVLRVMLAVVGSVMLAILALSCDCGSRIASHSWSRGRCVALCSWSSRRARSRRIVLTVITPSSRSSHRARGRRIVLTVIASCSQSSHRARVVALCSQLSYCACGHRIVLAVVGLCSRSLHHIVLISPIISLLPPRGLWLRTGCRADDIDGPFQHTPALAISPLPIPPPPTHCHRYRIQA